MDSKGAMGWALILLAVVAGLAVVALLYKWETSERVVATVPPTRSIGTYPTPTPTFVAIPQTKPTEAPTIVLPPGTVSYARDVLPIFQTRCLGCHARVTLGGLDLSSYGSIMRTGNHAPVVVPGDAQGSILFRSLRGQAEGIAAMPPGSPLSSEQVEVIGRWIDQGAPEN